MLTRLISTECKGKTPNENLLCELSGSRRINIFSFAWILLLIGTTNPIFAAEDSDSEASVLTGTVIRVIDGDSILVKGEDGTEQQVHLEGIDAPEIKQASGDQATKVLESMVKGKSVEIKWKKKDDYQRILGQVYQESVHINLKMIDKGYAWHFARYFKSDDFADAEKKAKSNKVGLWSDSSPTPPWDYRKTNRNAEKSGSKSGN